MSCEDKTHLYDLLTACKELVRTGWMARGVPPAIGESVAEHSWEAAILAYILAEELKKRGAAISSERAAVLALFHDILEGLTGDLPKYSSEKLGYAARRLLENKALGDVCLLGGEEVVKEWMDARTVEARIARLADYLSTYLQARRYLAAGYPGVEEILESTRDAAENLARLLGLQELLEKIVNRKG